MSSKREINPRDAVALYIAALFISIFELLRTGLYRERVHEWLDNSSYVDLSRVILSGGLPAEHHFWGFPALIALFEKSLSLSGFAALVMISFIASVAAMILMFRLYGAAVSVAFLAVCPEWVKMSVVGGSEPLFVCLLLASFLAFRADRVWASVLFASLATTVRPPGVFAICAIVLCLIGRRDWRKPAISVSLALAIGIVYLAWVRRVSGDAFVSVRLYSSSDWPPGKPFSFPLVPLGKSLIELALRFGRTWCQPSFAFSLCS
jgi:hypothetical protein